MLRIRLLLLLAAFSAVPAASCGSEVNAAQNDPQVQTGEAQTALVAATPPPGDLMESCDNLPLVDKEACYARQAPDLMAECERMRTHRCAPYARVHELEEQLELLNAGLLQAAGTAYASYEGDQPGYVEELEQSFAAADRTWRAYRDAHCKLEPFVQGMARNEAANPAEACRADKTAARVIEVKEMLSIFKDETDDEQRKQ